MNLKRLREAFSDRLVEEIQLYGGMPHLSAKEMALRGAVAELLDQDRQLSDKSQPINCQQRSAQMEYRYRGDTWTPRPASERGLVPPACVCGAEVPILGGLWPHVPSEEVAHVSDQEGGMGETAAAPTRFRIWVLPCAFKKDGSPSLGSFGATIRHVVIIPIETWTQLCREDPALAATKFEVGLYED